MPRLFIGVWPDDAARDAIAALPRPDDAGVRWTHRDQWHVTLQFLGEVELDGLAERVRKVAAGLRARTVTLGPTTRALSRSALVIPVAGLDDVAAALSDEPFTGHLTIGRPLNRRLTYKGGEPIHASWEAHEIALIQSHLGGGPARYETVSTGAFAP